MKINARIHGGERQGRIKSFEVVEKKPPLGDIGDGLTRARVYFARLDPEQGLANDMELLTYDFYITDIMEADELIDHEYLAVEV